MLWIKVVAAASFIQKQRSHRGHRLYSHIAITLYSSYIIITGLINEALKTVTSIKNVYAVCTSVSCCPLLVVSYHRIHYSNTSKSTSCS